MSWIEATLNPVVTIQIIFLQILHRNTAGEHLSHLAKLEFSAASYCKVRMKLKTAIALFAARRSVAKLNHDVFDNSRWLGHRVFFVDGSSFSMPDKPTLFRLPPQ